MDHIVDGPVRRSRLYEQVLDRLIARINRGQLAPGSELPSERELMREMGVGRPTIREALSALERMGLIEINQGERARVITPTAEHMMDQISRTAWQVLVSSPEGPRHLREARGAVELAIVLTAIDRGTDGEIARIGEALEANRHALERGDKDGFVATDIAFHVAIAEASHNPIYVAVTRAVLGWLMDYRSRIVASGIDQSAAFREHELLFAKIAARDTSGAVDAMRRHLARVSGPEDRHLPDILSGHTPSSAPKNDNKDPSAA